MGEAMKAIHLTGVSAAARRMGWHGMQALFLSGLLWRTVAVQAQAPIELADQRTHSVAYSGCARAGDTWVTLAAMGFESGTQTSYSIRGLHPDGTAAWEHPFAGDSGPGVAQHLVQAPDGAVLVAGRLGGCDVLPQSCLLARVDAAGNLAWVREYGMVWVNGLAAAPDGRIALLGAGTALVTDADGNNPVAVDLTTNGLAAPTRLEWADGTSWLCLLGDGRVQRRSLQNQVLASSAAPIAGVLAMTTWQGQAVLLTGAGQLHVFDNALQQIETVDLGVPMPAGRLEKGEGALWAIGQRHGVELDDAFAVLRTVDHDPLQVYADMAVEGAAVQGSMLAVAGSVSTADRQAGLFRTATVEGEGPQHDPDVSIAVQSVDSTWYRLIGNTIHPKVRLTVRLTNEGSDALHGLLLNHRPPAWGVCSPPGTSHRLQGLALPPGASTTFTWDSIPLAALPQFLFQFDVPQQVCVAALSPNDLLDRDRSDNEACGEATFVMGVDEVAGGQPFGVLQDLEARRLELRFQAPVEAGYSLAVTDACGRVVVAGRLAAGTTSHWLDADAWAPGVYHVHVQGATARWTIAVALP
jgi:hypothetical protein